MRRIARGGIGMALGALVWGLTVAAAPPPLPDVTARLRSPKAAVRAEAARELGERGSMADNAALAGLLRDEDPLVRDAAHDALWHIWMRSGDPEVDALMTAGVTLMDQGSLDEAIGIFSEIIRRRPNFAEGWNKRATALFLAKRYRESIADCERTLELNPYHVGALSGLGLDYIGLEDFEAALGAFRRALRLMPYSAGTKRTIHGLERVIGREQKRL